MESRKAKTKIDAVDIFRDDYTKQISLSRIVIVIILTMFIIYALLALYKTGVLADIPTGWLTLLLGQYGLNKGASVVSSFAESSIE